MHDPHTHTDIDLERVRIYEGDELIFDGSDPTSYVVLRRPRTSGSALASPPARWTGPAIPPASGMPGRDRAPC